MRIVIAAAASLALAGCASSGPPRTPRAVIDRVLKNAIGEAQPSKVVAAEVAFARMAREEGQWTAFQEFSADGAVIHGQGGPIEAGPWLLGRENPPVAVQWAPKAIWMSCDGALAVSTGRFRDPEGTVGTFVTVWQRQADDSYRWAYDSGSADDPQPPPRRPDEPAGEDDIVVTAYDSIKGLVADCVRRGESVPPPPDIAQAEGTRGGSTLSRDGTLRWRWEHDPANNRRLVVDFYSGGMWQVGLDQRFAAPGAQ